jgi:antitoxin HicB
MHCIHPVELDAEPDGSAVNLWFPDVPGARTWGDDQAEGLALAEDCLVTALYGCTRYCEPIPRPSPPRGRPMIAVPPLVAAKLALYMAMREQGIDAAELARRLGVSEKTVQSILHLKRRVHIAHLEQALAQLGVRLEVIAREAA